MLKIFIKIVIIVAIFNILSPAAISASEHIPDFDGDGLSDSDESRLYHTDPGLSDTDNDGFDDFTEVTNGYSPLEGEKIKLIDSDTDKDGLNDLWEILLTTDLTNDDTDGDGYLDGKEVANGFNPGSAGTKKIEKLIEVNLSIQSLTYYFNGVALESFKVSSGLPSMPTPEGKFTVLEKLPLKNYGGAGFDFYYPDTKWNLHFTTGRWRYYIHGAYWHNNFGQPMSHGCVNVAYENMERLYNFAQVGTKVHIFK